MKLWIKLGVILFVAIMLSNPILADAPPLWQEFEIKSNNGRYVAQIRSLDKEKHLQPWECTYKLIISEIGEAKNKELWSCDYAYDGYPDGLLSDDGSTFVSINFWYYDTDPVVSIYRNGSKVGTIVGKDFNIPKSKLANTASHRLWLSEGGLRGFKSDKDNRLILEIITIDGKKHVVNVETGKISD